jgi:hypothetical protein
MEDTDSALVLRNGPVLASVWVMEDDYSYGLMAADEVMLNLEAILAMQCRLVHERLR